MPPSAADVRRWISGFEAADRAALDARRTEGPQRARSIALSLSLLEAARTAAGGRYAHDPRRAESDAAVRMVWDTLRQRCRR